MHHHRVHVLGGSCTCKCAAAGGHSVWKGQSPFLNEATKANSGGKRCGASAPGLKLLPAGIRDWRRVILRAQRQGISGNRLEGTWGRGRKTPASAKPSRTWLTWVRIMGLNEEADHCTRLADHPLGLAKHCLLHDLQQHNTREVSSARNNVDTHLQSIVATFYVSG